MAFELDDGGRAAAGFKGLAGDCVVRAVAIAMQRPYGEVYAALANMEAGYRGRGARGVRSARNGIHTRSAAFKRFMEACGWCWVPTMRVGQGCKTHLRADELPPGRLIVSVSRHYVAVVDGVIRDIADPSRGGTRCVYGYWIAA